MAASKRASKDEMELVERGLDEVEGSGSADRGSGRVLKEGVQAKLSYLYSREARQFLKKDSGSSRRNLSVSSGEVELEHQAAEGADKGGKRESSEAKNGEEAAPAEGGGSTGTERAKTRDSPLVTAQKYWRMITGKWINVLLLAMPFGLLSRILKWGPGPVFFLNFVTLIPLASMLGDLTEELADHMGDTIGGLLNASFGNAVEMVIGVQALLHNEIRVVQSSLLGSVLSNLLLVMGCCFLFGGIKHQEQKFNSTASVANLSLLFLATIALVLPTPLGKGTSYNLTEKEELLISRVAALFLLAMYIQLLVFQMVTHTHLFTDVDRETADADTEVEEEDEDDQLGLWPSLIGLVVTTAIVAVFSEFLVASIDDVCIKYNISKVFVGVILIPIVGNATEHMTAVSVAVKNRMELAMGIAVGSATQISVFVIPFLVIAGWIMDRPMSLNFSTVELILMIMSVIITIPVLTAGNSHWLHGSLLITCYLFICFAVWHENTPPFEGRRLSSLWGEL